MRVPLKEVTSIILELQGSDEGTDSNGEEVDLKGVLNTLGAAVVENCNYDENCLPIIQRTRVDFLAVKAQNPNATSKELTRFFLDSEFGDSMIASELAKMLRTEFHKYGELKDEGGMLEAAIDKITSKEYIDKIMDNKFGKVAKTLIRRGRY